MSKPSKIIKKLKKPFLVVAAVGLVAFGGAAIAGALSAGGSAGAAAGAVGAASKVGTAAVAGAAKAGGLLKGAAAGLGGLSASTKAAGLIAGGQLIQGATQPSEAELYREQINANHSRQQGSGYYLNNGGQQSAQQPVQSAQTHATVMQPNIQQYQSPYGGQQPQNQAQTQGVPQRQNAGIIARYDPNQGKFVSQ